MFLSFFFLCLSFFLSFFISLFLYLFVYLFIYYFLSFFLCTLVHFFHFVHLICLGFYRANLWLYFNMRRTSLVIFLLIIVCSRSENARDLPVINELLTSAFGHKSVCVCVCVCVCSFAQAAVVVICSSLHQKYIYRFICVITFS